MTHGRIPIPKPEELRADVRDLLPLIAEPGREPARTMAVLARQPELLAPFLGWAAALALEGVLSARDHELLALRVAWSCRSAFEWGEHAKYARAAGITDAEIAAVARRDHAWTARESSLLEAADEICASFSISDTTWAALAAHFDAPALVEILFVAGQYVMLSIVANAAGIAAPPGLLPLPSVEQP